MKFSIMRELYTQWKKDEQAPFSGWDFSYIKNRLKTEQLPWDYKKEAKKLIKKATAVLDIGTGGGEVFSSLGPFPKHTFATESWSLNVPLARKRLTPLGIKVVKTNKSGEFPFTNREFDSVLNRHSFYNEREVLRVLKDGGIFLTQQVGGDDLRDLVREFKVKPQIKKWTLEIAKSNLKKAGFKIEQAQKWSGKTEFKDVGAIVYTFKAIPWIVKNFSVNKYLPILEKLQNRLNKGEELVFTTTRFLIMARKQLSL